MDCGSGGEYIDPIQPAEDGVVTFIKHNAAPVVGINGSNPRLFLCQVIQAECVVGSQHDIMPRYIWYEIPP